jgi:hypothetical protein
MAYWRLAERYGPQIDLPAAKGDFDNPHTPVGGSTLTLGGVRVSQRRKWLRTWPLNLGVCTDTEVAVVRQWIDGTHGSGPFELWIGSAASPVLVNVAGFDPHFLFLGQQTLQLTLEEVGL